MAAALALGVAACGDPSGAGDDAATAGDASAWQSQDAAPSPSDPTYDVAGSWTWSATEVGEANVFVSCEISISNGMFDITCPRGNTPRSVGEGCEQVRDDLHMSGSVGWRFDGMLDTIVQYDGDACANLGYTSGTPFPLPAFASMSAPHDTIVELGVFLHDLGGLWRWRLDDATVPEKSLDCDATFGFAAGSGVQLDISCPRGEPGDVIPGCAAQSFFVVTASIAPGRLDGELADEVHHDGLTCGTTYPAIVRETTASMQARAH